MHTDVLVTISWLHSVPAASQMFQRFDDAGYSYHVHSTSANALTAEELQPLIPGVRACVCGSDEFNHEVIAQADRLMLVSRAGVGYDTIDLDACKERGILVSNTPGANARAVAEFAIGLIFAVSRRVVYSNHLLRRGVWDRTLAAGESPLSKVLGIIGLGHVGTELARLASSLGLEVLYNDILGPIASPELRTRFVSLEELLRTSDIVSLNVPLTDRTFHLLGAREIDEMKSGAYIINTARGPVVDEDALCSALQSGRIAGAGLDVFEREPLSASSPLFAFPDRVVLTTHMAGMSVEAKSRMLEMAVDNVMCVFHGEQPRSVVA